MHLSIWYQARDFWRLPALINHDGTLEGDHDLAIVVVAGGLHRHNADIWARPRLPLLQNLGLGVDGVALKDRVGESDFIPAQVSKDVLRNVGHTLPGHQRERKGRIDKRFAKFGLCCVVLVKVNRGGVLSQQGEPDIVRCYDCSTQWMLIHIADLELLEKATLPALFCGHEHVPPSSCLFPRVRS